MPTRSLLLASVLICSSFYSEAQVISTFDADTDGWTATGANGGATPVFSTTGGNPGGRISASDIPVGAALIFSYFNAPNKFLGNQCASYGKLLRFDLQQSVSRPYVSRANVILSNGTMTLQYFPTVQTYPAVAPSWTSYAVPLSETSGEWINDAGLPATEQEIKNVLCNLTLLQIRGRYGSSGPTPNGTASIDNIILEKLPSSPPPVINTFTPEAGVPMTTTVTIAGTGFGSTMSNNTVYFGAVKAAIVSVSTTELRVTVPAGARHGVITVVNTTTGLIAQSLKPFTPAFPDGGRILPASLKPRQEIALQSTSGNNVSGINLTDLDGDGWVDIIASELTAGISIRRNLGGGGSLTSSSFGPRIPLSQASGSVRVADIDGDTKPDIAVVYRITGNSGNVSFYRNTSTAGNISFVLDEVMPAPQEIVSDIQLADLDGDGRLDLLSTFIDGCDGDAFVIWQGMSVSGNIEFCFYQNFDFNTICNSDDISIGDLNNDKKPDVVVVNNSDSQFLVFQNNSTPGTVSLLSPFIISATSVKGYVNIADVNNDTKPDLLWRSLSPATSDIKIRLNANAGGNLAAANFSTEVVLASTLSNLEGKLSMADMNGDNKPDLIASDDADIAIFENMYTGGTFASNAFISYEIAGAGLSTNPTSVEAADLNGDFKPDLVFGTASSPPRLVLFENANAHTPVISLNTVFPLKGPVGSTVTITGDYFSTIPSENVVHFGAVRADVLTATKNQLTVTVPGGAGYAAVSVTRNRLTSRYHLPFTTAFSTGNQFTAASFGPAVNFTLSGGLNLDVADLDGDNKPDINAEGNSSVNYSFRNTHTGPTINTSSLTPDDTTAFTAPGPGLVDLDGDNKPDMVSRNGFFRNTSVLAEISFDPPVSFGGIANMHYDDFNKDGKTDITGTTSTSGSDMLVMENRTTSGPFVSGGTASMSSTFSFVKPAIGGNAMAADFNNDGSIEIAATNGSANSFTVWRNNNAPQITSTHFSSVGNFTTGTNPSWMYTGDLDVDGKVDLFIYYGTGVSSQIVSVFHNQSSGGTFAFVRQDFTLPAGVVGGPSTISDLDGDGKPEIVITSQLTNTFRVLKNNTTTGVINASSFTVSAPYTITAPRAVKAGDINLDGKPDLIFISVPNTLSVLQNLMPSASITFTTQPVSITAICTGGTASFTVAATGDNNLQYQWQIDNGGFVDLTNDAIFSGVNTATLTITNAPFSLNGKSFRALVHGDATLNTASASAVLPMDPKLCNVPPDITPTTVASNINGTVTLDLADLITDLDNNLDLSTLRIITQPSSGAQASIDANYNLIISYTGKPFSGQDVVLIEVCDLAGSCTQEEITINVIGDITVYNAVSNNGDGLNDFLTLEYIDFMEETKDNHVIIYNRWGDVVFEINDYDNKERVFRGLNKEGKELAPGTYFYRIEFAGNGNQKKRSDQTGFLTLK